MLMYPSEDNRSQVSRESGAGVGEAVAASCSLVLVDDADSGTGEEVAAGLTLVSSPTL